MSDTVSRAEAAHALGAAAEYDEDRIRVDDLLASGVEVGIAPESVRKALADAADNERARARLDAQRSTDLRSTLRFVKQVAAILTIAVAFLAICFGIERHEQIATLNSQRADADLAASQVSIALRRRDYMFERFGTRLDDPSANAEVTGACNRYYIAMRRYDEAATRFNLTLSSSDLGRSATGFTPLPLIRTVQE